MAAVRKTPDDPPSAAVPAAPQTPAEPGVSASPEPDAEVAPTPFEYTEGYPTVYPHIPLTARPASAAVAPSEATADAPAVAAQPARPATVFAFTAPPDGRWRPTDKPVNQAPDNEPAMTAEGV